MRDGKDGPSRALKEAREHVSCIVEKDLHVYVCGLSVNVLQVSWLAEVDTHLQGYQCVHIRACMKHVRH